MKRRRPYAEGTTVSVQNSRAELERLLDKAGADQILTGSDRARRQGFVAFTMQGRQYRLVVPSRDPGNRNPEQVEREKWRALVLIVKAKLEVVASGMTTAEREFMADLMLPGGTTVGDEIAPKIAQAYESGQQPPLLPAFGDT